MRRRHVLPFVLLAALTPAFARAADPLPSMEELQKSLDDKDYAAVLSGTSRVLALRGPATQSFHRTAVWMLKAEALLQTNQFPPAGQAFANAAEEKDATDEERDLAEAYAMLMKRADRKGYQIKPTRNDPSPKVYDVLDPAQRKEALGAMLAFEMADLPAKVDGLKTSTTPGPIITVAKRIAALRPVERVVDKSTEKLDQLEATLGKNYAAKMALWSDTNAKRLDELAQVAQQTVVERYTDRQGVQRTRTTLRGLNANEQSEVRNMQKDAKSNAQAEQAIEAEMTTAGKDAISSAQRSIQSLYDQATNVLRTALTPR